MQFKLSENGGVIIDLSKDEVLNILDSNNHELLFTNFYYENIQFDDEDDLGYISERFHQEIANASCYAATEENVEMINFIKEALVYSDEVCADVESTIDEYSIDNSYGFIELISEYMIRREHNGVNIFRDIKNHEKYDNKIEEIYKTFSY